MQEKVLFITQFSGFIGGMERYISSMSDLLRKQGMRTTLLYLQKARGAELFEKSFDEVYDKSQAQSLDANSFSLKTLHKILDPQFLDFCADKFAPTVFVHDHSYFCPKGFKYFPTRENCRRAYSPFFCGICASLVPPRHIKNLGLGNMLSINFKRSPALFTALKKCPRFVVLSDFMKNELRSNGIGADKILKIAPFLEFPQEVAQKKWRAKPTILFAGQQVMSKGTLLFLEAVAKMKKASSPVIIGDGARLNYFRECGRRICPSAKFAGWVSNPDEYFADADIAAFPSMWQEPFGLSGIEAMAASAPVVGFDTGGVGEWLKDGFNGILVPPRDTDAMAEAFDKLADNIDLRKTLAKNAADFARTSFTKEKFLESIKELL